MQARAIAGDRDALVEYALRFFDLRMRRRVGGKLRAAGVTVIDEDDVFTSAGRRLLMRCERSGIEFTDGGHLDAYLAESAMNLAREKARSERSKRRTIGRMMRSMAARANNAPELTAESAVELAMLHLRGEERRMVELRLRGLTHAQIAASLGLTLSAYRARWRSAALAWRSPPDSLLRL